MIPLICIGSFCAAALLMVALNHLALASWRRSAGLHWSERARRLHPARVASFLMLFLIPANLSIASAVFLRDAPSLAVALPAFLGALLGSHLMDRVLFPELRWKSWLGSIAATWLLHLAPLSDQPCASRPAPPFRQNASGSL